MGKLIFENSMSLDGFVAGPNDGPDNPLGDGGRRLFDWYQNGEVAYAMAGTDMVFHVSPASADYLRENWSTFGSMIAGRRMFDIAGAWGGRPPGGDPCFIMTHHPPEKWFKPDSPFTFVTDGIESAVTQARAAAGDKDVSISSASIAQQCLQAGLLDELWIDMAPVLLGGGVRLFDKLGVTPLNLEILKVVAGKSVTHLQYRIVH